MNILNYYLYKQENYPKWVIKFQSTSDKQSGKIFSYVNTNFRYLSSFINQSNKFICKNGKERSKWHDNQKNGQEKDKHRIIPLLNGGFINFDEDCYFVTPKAIVTEDLAKQDLKKNDNFFLILLLILDYKTSERSFDIFGTTNDIYSCLNEIGLKNDVINDLLKECIKSPTRESLFKKDAFWYLTFCKDFDFCKLYQKSTLKEKQNLHEYVIGESKDVNSKDLIAHKFKNSGAYSLATFIEDAIVLYITNYIRFNIKNIHDFEYFYNKLLDVYTDISYVNSRKDIVTFIENHKSIYESIYIKLKGEF